MLLCVSSPALGSLTTAWVRYCTMNFTGLKSPTGCSSSWQWQFINVWTAAHHCTWWTTACLLPVLLLGGVCVPPTVNNLQYLAASSMLIPVLPFQLPAPQSGILFQISSGTRPSVQTDSDVCLRRICLLYTSAFSTLKILMITALYKSTYLLTYLLTYLRARYVLSLCVCVCLLVLC